jgi:hypothetical protein
MQIAAKVWTVAEAARLFSEQENNEDFAVVELDNKMGAHWVRRVKQLIERGVSKVTAYDCVAARARKSRRWIQDRMRVYETYSADELEEYLPAGISFLIGSLSRQEPQAFLQEAIQHPCVTLDTLLAEYQPREDNADDDEELHHAAPPFPPYLFGVNRRLSGLADLPKSKVMEHMNAIVEIFKQNGVE